MQEHRDFFYGVFEYLIAAGYSEEQVNEMTLADAVDLFILIFELESGNINGI